MESPAASSSRWPASRRRAAASRSRSIEIVFATDWLAQAEHGGFYQAVAEGTYRKHGLDVTIRMGGPQVNGLQLLAAGQLDVVMGDALQVLSAVEQNVPVDGHRRDVPEESDRAHRASRRGEARGPQGQADRRQRAASNTTFWPWLKQRYGFTDDQKRPYAFSVQPFLVDTKLSQQGFATSEPFSIEKGGVEAGRVPARRAGLSALFRSARRAARCAARTRPMR